MRKRPTAILLIVLAATVGVPSGGDSVEDDLAGFIARHWRLPLAPQGTAPASFSPLEASLAPDRCGVCHPDQYRDWRRSIHALSMGPGVSGQLLELARQNPQEALRCYTCHAPLAEQRPGHAGFDAALTKQGIVCASCHVREWERFGPPRRDGSLASVMPREQLPHRGATRTAAFLRSEFCRDCHQFPAGGLALNGKLLQDTYEEWRRSPAAAAGVQCQDCHMPDRRHEWRGIHDPDTVRRALAISVSSGEDGVSVTLTNEGAGHRVPTYVTPRIVVSGELLDADGHALDGTRREAVIGREVTLDLSREIFDTRLAPGQSAVFRYRPEPGRGHAVRVRVRVEPDHFYTRFFSALLRQGAGAGEADIRAAFGATRESAFVLFEREMVLP